MANNVKFTVDYYPDGFKLFGNHSESLKSFKDEMSAIEWCRKHHENIFCINDYRTFGENVSHFEIMDALRGVSR